MFKNLDAEQARAGLSNAQVAERLGISRQSYEGRLCGRTGFKRREIWSLIKLFGQSFEYLFAADDDQQAS